MSYLTRLKIEAKDALRFSPLVRQVLSKLTAARAAKRNGLERVELLCKAIRLSPSDSWTAKLEDRLRIAADATSPTAADLIALREDHAEPQIPKAAILKPWISDQEKGIVFISFEEQWARLLQCSELEGFAERYQLVISPTWSPPQTTFNCMFPRVYPGKIVTLISNERDMQYFPSMSPDYVPVELYASSWVQPETFTPMPFETKDIDLIVISNFGLYKRHFELFKALREMPVPLKVVCVGQANGGRSAEVLMNEAAAYGVADRIDLRESVSNEELLDLLCRAKTSAIFSRREGSCVVVVESMFADTPIGLFEDAGIGSKVFINEQTGRLLSHRNLADDLYEFVQMAQGYSPRKWVMENGVSCHGSTTKLNAFLKEFALAEGAEWAQDIYAQHWRPNPLVIDPDEALIAAKEAQTIYERFGIDFTCRTGCAD
ncbi:hypothetical protein BVY04_01335 [bacterium M21]|nr:hypothetical protein BVY04_01335 [bacterium M21]